MSSTTTLGQFTAAALIAAKKAGRSFKQADLATEIDLLHTQWTQQANFKLAPECPATKIPPTPEAVTLYAQSIGYPMDGREFCDAYGQKGWFVGKAKMKNWHFAVSNWKRNSYGRLLTEQKRDEIAQKPRDYSKI